MENVPCNFCGSDDLIYRYSMPDWRFHADEIFDVVECAECGLAFVNPRPSRSEIVKYYPKEFYSVFKNETPRYNVEVNFIEKLYHSSGGGVLWLRGEEECLI